MRTIRAGLIISGAVAACVMTATLVHADAQCKRDAIAAYKDCQSQCKSDFDDAKFTCRNIDPICGNACLSGRQACMDGVEEILDTGVVSGHCSGQPSGACLVDADCPNGQTCVVDSTLDNCTGGTDACDAAFATQATGDPSTGGCGATCGPQGQVCSCHGDETCAQCLVTAQITRFGCRDECRASFRFNPVVIMGRTNCRNGFKGCVKACPPATPPG